MYNNRWFCDSLEYVLENRESDHVISFVDVPREKLPVEIYRDELDWAVWKRSKGYRLYTVSSVESFGMRILDSDGAVPDGFVRLYRLMRRRNSS